MKNKLPNILITGGSGFLGSRIIQEFLCEDSPLKPGKLVVYDIQPYSGPISDMIDFIKADIRDLSSLKKAAVGIDIIIHCAAIIDWGTKSEKEVLSINVGGTKNVVEVCKQQHIQHLVYTSSLDAVFSGKPLSNIDENQPYPESYHTVYCESKALGEQAVLQAASPLLSTCVLRPSDIYGEADPYHMDALIDMAKGGFYVRLGNGRSKCQHVYVGNMAHAHVIAAKALWTRNTKVNRQVYFITDQEGINFFRFFDRIVTGAGYKIYPKNLWLPFALAYAIGAMAEFIAFIWRPIRHYNPKFSRFSVLYTCNDFTFSAKKAEQDFDFRPKYDHREALENTVEYYSEQRENKP